MVKVIYANLQSAKRSFSPAVSRKRVRTAEGGTDTVLVLNADSPDFADDLTHAFKRNVARVRRENKRWSGAATGAAVKA